MTEILYSWLEQQFRLNNHNKYHKYFVEWIKNITPNQIDGFEIQRISLINGLKKY